jgi:hypothetical protein
MKTKYELTFLDKFLTNNKMEDNKFPDLTIEYKGNINKKYALYIKIYIN